MSWKPRLEVEKTRLLQQKSTLNQMLMQEKIQAMEGKIKHSRFFLCNSVERNRY
jgi:hypothetical protein